MTSDQPPLLDRAEMAVVRRDFVEGGGVGCYGDGHDDFSLASFSDFSRRPFFFPSPPSTPPPLLLPKVARSSRLYIQRGLISQTLLVDGR